ncbi:uncharacterized protein CLUP02_11421 [Colletotrichum lupini]|uniref:Uncharacterized protein n=1 Tax=Colletotrichum lupini TaxID=145971 RepID=A0A9Q8T0D5_9PEZI|nr:uncharacterized protein CLUP02_11421 [Colletotrichum lupini]UQC85922.1 hypothetical protein CLUP02_11421 [Colletotrichum lupini]
MPPQPNASRVSKSSKVVVMAWWGARHKPGKMLWLNRLRFVGLLSQPVAVRTGLPGPGRFSTLMDPALEMTEMRDLGEFSLHFGLVGGIALTEFHHKGQESTNCRVPGNLDNELHSKSPFSKGPNAPYEGAVSPSLSPKTSRETQ